jgi:hypothetical protein
VLSEQHGFGLCCIYHDRDYNVGTNNGLRGRRCAAPARGHELFDRRGAHVAASDVEATTH